MKQTIDDAVNHLLTRLVYIGKHGLRTAAEYILMELGVPGSYDGYQFMLTAIVLYVEDPVQIILKGLYTAIADQYGGKLTTTQIEQAMRKAIDISWKNGSRTAWFRYFSHLNGGKMVKPSNKDFVSHIGRVLDLWKGCCEAGVYLPCRKENCYEQKEN